MVPACRQTLPLDAHVPAAAFQGKAGRPSTVTGTNSSPETRQRAAPAGLLEAQLRHPAIWRGGLKWPISRVLSRSEVALLRGEDHSSRPTVASRLKRYTRGRGRAAPNMSTIRPCTRMGFAWPTRSPGPPVRSYRTLSTLPTPSPEGLDAPRLAISGATNGRLRGGLLSVALSSRSP